MANLPALYVGGELEAAIALSGPVTGRIDQVFSAREIIDDSIEGFNTVIKNFHSQYGS
ncbi:hypothetical protein OAI12_01070 [Porticoccaceae bacterium]|nr:hypothetical protein [Porticoccaceae bacterium]